MGDDTLKVAIGVEDDAVSARLASSVGSLAGQDWELVKGSRIGEAETLVVIVLVGVPAGSGARLQVVEALLDGVVDVRLAVAGVAAGVGALARLEQRAGHGGGAESDHEEGLEGEHGGF